MFEKTKNRQNGAWLLFILSIATNSKAIKPVCVRQKLNKHLKMQKAKRTLLLNSFETYRGNTGYLGYTPEHQHESVDGRIKRNARIPQRRLEQLQVTVLAKYKTKQ